MLNLTFNKDSFDIEKINAPATTPVTKVDVQPEPQNNVTPTEPESEPETVANSEPVQKTDVQPEKGKHETSCAPGPRVKCSDLTRAGARPVCCYWRVSCEGAAGGELWLTWGQRFSQQ